MNIIRLGRTVALTAATALLAGAALLAPAADTAANAAITVSVSGPTTITAGTTGAFTFSASGDYNSGYAHVTAVDTRVSPTYPTVSASGTSVLVTTGYYTTPGTYRLDVTLYTDSGPYVGAANFVVRANTSYSKAQTSTNISGKVGKRYRTTFSVWGPSYQRGASAQVYYRFKGTKKFVKVAAGKLNASGDVKLRTKKGKIRKAGTYYVKIGGVGYAGAYTTTWHKAVIR
jgi:hypothetical protein